MCIIFIFKHSSSLELFLRPFSNFSGDPNGFVFLHISERNPFSGFQAIGVSPHFIHMFIHMFPLNSFLVECWQTQNSTLDSLTEIKIMTF